MDPIESINQVLKDGTYVPAKHAKANYSGMVWIRAGMCSNYGEALAKACTIASRYSIVRKQGQIDKSLAD